MTLKRAAAVYIPVFYGIWILWEFWGNAAVTHAVANEAAAQLLKSGVIKNAVWTLPAMLLIHHFRTDLPIGLWVMFTTRVRWRRVLPVFALFTLYLLGGALLQRGDLAISGTFRRSDLITVLFVGITEETVFRGWLLNAALRGMKQWPAIFFNALLFLLIHFPVWIHEGQLIGNFQSFGFLCILILSGIFSWSFIKSRNILVPVLLHMYWDLLMFLFY